MAGTADRDSGGMTRREDRMLKALKKLVGADEESKARRKEAAEQERREREQRVQQQREALKKSVEAEKKQDPD
jgi:non-homologous end joining protein Ku